MAQQTTRVTGGNIVRDHQYDFSDDGTRFILIKEVFLLQELLVLD